MVQTQTEYHFSKVAIFILSIILLFFLSVLVFMLYIFYSSHSIIILFVGLFFFALLLFIIPTFYKRIAYLIKKIPALILTDTKLIDNINLQVFNWADIKEISSSSVYVYKTDVNYIAISLFDSAKYFTAIKNPYKKFIAKLNERYFHGAFSIQPNIIKCNNKELLQTLIKYLDSARQ